MNSSLTTTPRVFTVWYQDHEIRVSIGEEVRFTTEDICKVAGVRLDNCPIISCASALLSLTASSSLRAHTVGWSEALNLIDAGTLAPDDLQQSADWFLSDIIQILCEENMLTGEEIIDTSLVQYSGFFRKAFQAASLTGQDHLYLLH